VKPWASIFFIYIFSINCSERVVKSLTFVMKLELACEVVYGQNNGDDEKTDA